MFTINNIYIYAIFAIFIVQYNVSS